jgi:hypothetical protein
MLLNHKKKPKVLNFMKLYIGEKAAKFYFSAQNDELGDFGKGCKKMDGKGT